MSIGLAVGLHLGRGGAVGPRIVAWDNFTDTDGTALESHTPTGGGTWTKHTSSGAGSATINANRAHNTNTTAIHLYYHSWVPGSANYAASCGVVLISDNDLSLVGPCVRMDTVANTSYQFRYATASNAWRMTKAVAGTASLIGSAVGQVLTLGQRYEARIEANGSTLIGLVDGVEIVRVVDTDITAAGRAGIFLQAAADAATGLHLDDWQVIA